MKKIKIFFIICFFALFLTGGITTVTAGELAFRECSQITLTEKFIETAKVSDAVTVGVNKTETIYITGDDSTVVYCTEKGKPIIIASGATEATYKAVGSSSGTNMWIARAIAYGYPELLSGHSVTTCADRRMATQLLVQLIAKQGANGAWKTYSARTFDSFVTGSRASQVSDAMLDIRNKMLREDSRPSFNGLTLELKYVPSNYYWRASITDANDNLSDWSRKSSGVTVSVSGNTLTITQKTPSPTSGTITFTKSAPSGTLYESTYSTRYQQTVHYKVGNNKTLSSNLKYRLEEIGKGTIKIHKTDSVSGSAISGVSFEIYSNSNCTTKATDYLGNELSAKTTGSSGEVEWNNLYFPMEKSSSKIYYVKETKVPPEYENYNIGTCVPVTLKSSDNEVAVNHSVTKEIENIPKGRAKLQWNFGMGRFIF